MRKFIILLVGALVAFLFTAVSVQPANAASWTTSWACSTTNEVKTCAKAQWAVQADGTGVRLEGFWVDTSAGCTKLEDSGGKYNPVTASFQTPSGVIDYYYAFGAEGCSFYKDLSNAGQDLHNMEFQIWAKARMNLASDKTFTVRWTLHPDGTYSRDTTLYY